MNGKCVDFELYPTTAAQAPSSPSSRRVPPANAPPTLDTQPKVDGLSVSEETTLSTKYENDRLSSNSNVRAATQKMLPGSRQTAGERAFTAPLSETSQGHSVGSSSPTKQEALTTPWELITTRAPISWDERPAVSLNTAGERMLASSSHPDDRLSSGTEGTTISEISVSSTQYTGSEDASSSSIVDSSVHHGKASAHYDGVKTSTLAREEGGSTDGPTALSRQLVTSSGPNSEDFRPLPTHIGSPFVTVSGEIPGFTVRTTEATASIFDSVVSETSASQEYAGSSEFSDKYHAATAISYEDTHHPSSPGRDLTIAVSSTYDDSSTTTSAGSSTMSGGIESSSNALGHSSVIASSTTPSHNAGTRASTVKEQAVDETEEEDISIAHLTKLDSLRSDLSSLPSRENIASGSTDPEEPSTTMSYAMKVVTETSNPTVTETAASTREKDDSEQGSPAHIRHLTPPSRVTSEKVTSDSTSHRLSVGLSALLTVLLFFSGSL